MKDSIKWRDIPGYKGYYIISNEGTVISLPRVVSRTVKNLTIHQPLDGVTLTAGSSAGYPSVGLYKDGKGVCRYVHDLVAETFLGKRPSPKHHICHNDGNPLNPSVTNLRYDLPAGNQADRVKHGTDNIGINNPMAKHSEETVSAIKKALKNNTQRNVSHSFNIPYSTIKNIAQGKTWKHINA